LFIGELVMKIVFCSAEVVPFSQAGGLGDVMGSLPRAIGELKHSCIILTPMYGFINPDFHKIEKTDIAYHIHFNGKTYPISIWKGVLPRSEVPVYFIDNYELFGARKEVYPYGQPEWELEGFLVFSQATFELLRRVRFRPDVLHVNDWHTASMATTLASIRPYDQYFSRTHSVLTIHNLHYQGMYGDTNWLREGIYRADAVTTVSPTYAQEIQMPEFGAGLDDVMRDCKHKLSGILNGIDTELFNPQTDTFLTKHYTGETFVEGKAACKADLQAELGLPAEPDVPLIGFVGRLVDQKGLDILIPAMEALENSDTPVQFALLGTGDPEMEDALKALNTKTKRIRSYVGFNTAMAMKIYAGSDMFVMPSAYEPCGLGQMIALRYGSVPVVRAVGGLADTIKDVRNNPTNGNGFLFSEYDSQKLQETLQAARVLYQNRQVWHDLIRRGMAEDHSWRPSALAYEQLYNRLGSPAATSHG
jgi:starch synthase